MQRIGSTSPATDGARDLFVAIASLALIFALSVASIAIAPSGAPVASWWPAAGVSVLLALRFTGRGMLAVGPAIFVVTLLANMTGGREILVAIGFGLANAVEAVIASRIIRGRERLVPRLDSLAVLARLLLGAFAGAAAIGLVAGVTIATLRGGDLVAVAVAVAPSHAAAILLIVPLGLRTSAESRASTSMLEVAGAWVLLVAIVAVVFGLNVQQPLAFLPLAALVWSATRLRFRVVQWQLVALGVVVAVLSALGRGPFNADRFGNSIAASLVQAFVITCAIVMLTLAVLVAAQREATRALAHSELLFRENFSNALVGMIIVSRREDDFTVARANAVATEVLGLDDQPAGVDRGVFSVFTPAAVESLRAAMPERGSAVPEATATMPGGWRAELPTLDERVIDVSIAVLDSADDARLFALQLVDVSERARAERAMLRALDYEREAASGLRELDRMKDELISSVSHELRTPLAGILGYTEMLLDGDAGELGTSQTEMVGTIERSGRRLRRIVDDLLVISSLDGAEKDPDLQFVDAVGAVRSVVAELRPLAESKSHRLVFTAAEDRSLTIEAIPDDIDKVLVNLIGNAIKYTPKGGSIHVSVRADAEAVRFDVFDNGVGIALDDQAKVFNRFYRAETSSDEVSGTGLGLAIVDLLVRRNDGTIELESEPDRGTRVTVRFARVDGPEAKATQPLRTIAAPQALGAVRALAERNEEPTARHPMV